jgi:hypothetical protein
MKTSTKRPIKMIKMLPLSDHNAHNSSNNSNNFTRNSNTTTVETDPGVSLLTEATATDQTRAPTLQETVNSAFTAKFLTTPKKSAAKELMIKSPVLMEKDNYTGLKSITSPHNLLTMIPIMKLIRFFSQELHDSPHECSKCHSSIDFEFVYCVHRYVQ